MEFVIVCNCDEGVDTENVPLVLESPAGILNEDTNVLRTPGDVEVPDESEAESGSINFGFVESTCLFQSRPEPLDRSNHVPKCQ
jgi:hypothetical protein